MHYRPHADSSLSSQEGPVFATAHSVHARARRKWWLIGGTALVITAALIFGLVFGLNSSNGSNSSSDASNSSGSRASATDCATLSTANYWEYLTPSAFNLTLELGDPSLYLYTTNPPTAFNATTSLALNVSQPISCVVLQAAGMEFSSVKLAVADASGGSSSTGGRRRLSQAAASATSTELCGSGGGSAPACGDGVVSPVSTTTRPVLSSLDQNLITINLGNVVLEPGVQAVLTLVYSGTLGLPANTANASGLHRSAPYASCSDANSGCDAKTLVITQLEPYAAKQLLPCYDSPRFRATFGVTVQHPPGTLALSNTRGTTSTTAIASSEMLTTRFATTPSMPAYLLAVTVGELRRYNASTAGASVGGNSTSADAAMAAAAVGPGISGGTASGMDPEIRLWAVPGREGLLALAAKVAPAAFRHYLDYMGVGQPLDKFDLIAVPGRAGAIENWGCLIFDERRLLYNSSAEGAWEMWRAADVVCHEMAHQWFGNLVTVEDFSQLSLQEGMATLLEYDCMAAALPALPTSVLQFRSLSPMGQAPGPHEGPMLQGLVAGSDPLRPALIADDDLSAFDEPLIVYAKSGSYLHMGQLFLDQVAFGSDVDIWEVALQAVMRKYSYNSVTWRDTFAEVANEITELLALNATAIPATGLAYISRVQSWLDAGNMTAQRATCEEGGLNGGPRTLCSWLYLPTYPWLSPDKALALNPQAYSDSILLGSATSLLQQRFCGWNSSSLVGVPASLADAQALEAVACGDKANSVPLFFDNITSAACLSDGANGSLGGTVAVWGSNLSVLASSYTASRGGVPLYRVAYSDDHLDSLAANVEAATHICEENTTDTCCMTQSEMLAAAQLLADSVAFAQNQQYAPDKALAAMLRVVQSQLAGSTGAGQYLFQIGVMEAVQTLGQALFDPTNNGCPLPAQSAVHAFLSPYADGVLADLLNATLPAEQETSSDTILKRLAGPQILSHYALAGGNETAGELCALLPATPLWNYITANASSGSSSDAAAAAAAATGSGTVPVELLPAIYMTAAGLPDACAEALAGPWEQAFGADSDSSSMVTTISAALRACFSQAEGDAEAERCLYALPWLPDSAAIASVQQWALTLSLPYAGAGAEAVAGWAAAGGEAGGDAAVAAVVRSAGRRWMMTQAIPRLFRLVSGRGPLFWQVAFTELNAWLADVQARAVYQAPAARRAGPAVMCSIIDAFMLPQLAAQKAQWDAFLADGGPAASCSAAVRLRALARAEQLQQLRLQYAKPMCAALNDVMA